MNCCRATGKHFCCSFRCNRTTRAGLRAMGKPTLYCYAPQLVAVELHMAACGFGGHQVKPVDDPLHIRGEVRGVFVYVTGHNQQMPARFYQDLRAYGFMMVALDPRYVRERAINEPPPAASDYLNRPARTKEQFSDDVARHATIYR